MASNNVGNTCTMEADNRLDSIKIREKDKSDCFWAEKVISDNWYSKEIILDGERVIPLQHEGLVARKDGRRVGLLTYRVTVTTCQILTLNALVERRGIGSALIRYLQIWAQNKGCSESMVATTNDNTEALLFYQQLGFQISAVKIDDIDKARRLKPEIPLIGNHGMPIRDEFLLRQVL